MKPLTHKRLLECLRYNASSGKFYWKISQGNKKVGQSAGTYSSRYPMVSIDKKRYDLHRVAWFYITGRWPAIEIDHKNKNAHNNRFSNLREATSTQNNCNHSRAPGASGHTGIWIQRGKYRARITFNKRIYNLGLFPTLKSAIAARSLAEQKYHGEFARTA